MFFLLPGDIFSGYIEGHRQALYDNWQNEYQFNTNESRQLSNFAQMMGAEELYQGRPGALATRRAQSDFLVHNADALTFNDANFKAANDAGALQRMIKLNPELGGYQNIAPLNMDYLNRKAAAAQAMAARVEGLGPSGIQAPGTPGVSFQQQQQPGFVGPTGTKYPSFPTATGTVAPSPSGWVMQNQPSYQEPLHANTGLFFNSKTGRYESGDRPWSGY
ncbi:MAG: hypothetical protein LBQ12_14240 [Deltaproteobacteria bacterium]|jgi:hypothetical protein|nr:hypothetical protein [Deltaproteobacteria bacterium]